MTNTLKNLQAAEAECHRLNAECRVAYRHALAVIRESYPAIIGQTVNASERVRPATAAAAAERQRVAMAAYTALSEQRQGARGRLAAAKDAHRIASNL